MWLKSTISWIENKWASFEAKVQGVLPGYKTKLLTGLATVGTGAAILQEYVGGLPLNDLLSTKSLALVNMGLYTLAYWFRGLGDRVEARIPDPKTSEQITTTDIQ